MENNEDALNTAIAVELRKTQAVTNISNRKIADDTGIPYVTVGRMLRGERPITVTVLAALAHAMGETTADLVDRAEKSLDSD